MKIVKIISTAVENSKRIIKYLGLGKSDVQTSNIVAPFGIDSNPIADMIALQTSTDEDGKTIIIGYINKNQLADVGELRLFSTDADGIEQKYVWLKNDNTIEIGGNTDNLVRFSELETAFNELQGKWNTFADSYIPGGPTAQGSGSASASTADISGAKIDEIKTL